MSEHQELSLRTRIVDALDTPWERPTPTTRQLRLDVLYWVLYLLVAMLMQLAYLSVGLFDKVPDEKLYREFLAILFMTLPLMFRRRFPLSMVLVGTGIFYVFGFMTVITGGALLFQISYFCLLYSAVAWAQDRRNLWIIYTLVALGTLVFIVLAWTIQGSAYSIFGYESSQYGPFSIAQGSFLVALFSNTVFFGGALVLGNISWKNAYRQDLLRRQQEQLILQSDRMAQNAVIEDRLRIARELHDSIGHHIAAIGVQTSAARRFAEKKPELLAEPLENIENLARTSVAEMRAVLGVLRADETADIQPSLSDLSALTALLEDAGIASQVTVSEDNSAPIDSLSQGISLSLYRIVQEAVSNVIKHSAAQNVAIAVRTSPSWTEVEVTDDGIPTQRVRAFSADDFVQASGYGLRGIRERAQVLGGEAEIGHREAEPGWRVRVRIPR